MKQKEKRKRQKTGSVCAVASLLEMIGGTYIVRDAERRAEPSRRGLRIRENWKVKQLGIMVFEKRNGLREILNTDRIVGIATVLSRDHKIQVVASVDTGSDRAQVVIAQEEGITSEAAKARTDEFVSLLSKWLEKPGEKEPFLAYDIWDQTARKRMI